ncbi:LysR family transcriptional regulator [Streptantibioticus ferralitis]|uniref:LysR family transcriptional regulator n=1 Tax=Streptantibioticus ferralitis TaxID=236510 RepID=A0ABT5YU43_9ACTN|nr:LysR family transcriptional regulator [Streptantibioticus ferralitis]MDF2255126.1 LysR family transcriptional regulator [Streptantibioticus ferralitis]
MQLDLNLLTALNALLEEGSVAGAADRLHLSAPAMSRTLGRIRRATGDQILVRTGRTMTPTPRALALRDEVHSLVQRAHDVLSPDHALDLGTLERTFTLQCHDAVTTAIGPGLLAAIESRAPGVTLRLLGEAPVDTGDLRRGRVDLEIGGTEPDLPEINFEALGHDHLVAAVRPQHPLTRGELNVDRYAQARHITVSRRGRPQDAVDDALTARGLHRRVVVAAPTSAAALHLVRHSDLVVAVPERMCRPTVTALGLRTLAIPLDLAPARVNHAWHHRYDTDKAHTWLRAQVREQLQAICEPTEQ